VVWCGKYIQYAYIDRSSTKVEIGKLHNLEINLPFTIEILRVLKTTQKNTIQLITYDHRNTAYRFITWDIGNKYELTILEKISDSSYNQEFFICRGMIKKYNYYVGQTYVKDLEHNTPFAICN